MKPNRRVLLPIAISVCLFLPAFCSAMLSPYVTDQFTDAGQSAALWNINGNIQENYGLEVSDAGGASLISSVAVPDGSTQYQITILTGNGWPDNPGAAYVLYLEATPNALLNLNGASSGSFYAFAVQSYSGEYGMCQSQVTLYKVVNGSVTQIASAAVSCNGGYTAVAAPDGSLRFEGGAANGGQLYEPIVWTDTATPLTGAAGLGAAGPGDGTAATISEADIYPIDRVAPSSIPASTVQTYAQPTEVDIRTAGSADDSNGVGLYQYQWYRDGEFVASTFGPEYSDLSVAAGSSHTYGVNAIDFDGNASVVTSFTVTTPATAAVDPRQIGLRSTGSYWGGMGEQIDVRSGNLNYSYPLITPTSRGLAVPLTLSYNSQNWRQDSSGNVWSLGTDTGYGYGWQLQFGSVTPYYSSTWDVAFYQFRDASGAVYRLDQNNNGVWTSKDSTYVSFNDQADILYFTDGSQWSMWDVVGGDQPDAGTMYPYYMEDSNGNLIYIGYNSANNGSWATSQISTIYDARSPFQESYDVTYDSTGHLSSITNNIGSGESFTFIYSAQVTLASPFATATQFWPIETLNAVTNAATNLTTSFSWDPSNDGELTQVTFPYGGYMRWQYGSTAYAQAMLRTIQNRYLLWDNTIGERSFAFSMALGSGSTANGSTTVIDAQAQALKLWGFDTQQDATQGLVTLYKQYGIGSQNHGIQREVQYSWVQDPTGRNYIGRTRDIANVNTPPFTVTKQTDQVMDLYGNVLQTKLYTYNNLNTPAKTYTNTYLTDPNYTSLHIFNRLLSSTVTDANANTLTLVTNTYDGSALADAPGVSDQNYFYDTSFIYRGNLTSSTSFSQVVNTEYDITGSVVYTDDGNSNHSLTVTNSSAADYAAPSAITTANSMTTTFNWNSVLAPLSTTGPNGDAVTASYDPSTSQPTSSTSPYGAVTTYSYSNTAPQIVATVNGGPWTQTYLDGLGRTARVAAGNGNTALSYTDTVYDACGCTPVGKPYKRSLPYTPGSTPVWKTNTYDALGRTLTTVAPDGSSTTAYTYLGNFVTVTDAAGKWKQYYTDAFGELIQVVEQSPNPNTEPNHVTNYTYDILGHLTQVQMQRTVNGQLVTQTRTWTYDPNTQYLTQTTTPEAGTTQFTYNSDGTLATKTDAKNQQTQYSYDPYGRMIRISRGTLVNGQFTEDVTQRSTLAYDGTNNGFSVNSTGRLSQVSYSGPDGLQFTEWYSYHPAGAITAKQLSVSGTSLGSNTANFDAMYSYNSLGQMTNVQYPFAQWSNGSVVAAGPQYAYTYDAMNRLNGMTGPNNQTLVNSVSYGAANQMLQLNAASFTETSTYNASLQLMELVSGAYHYQYNYSATQNNGRIQSQTDVASGETIIYQYDSLNRLVQASGTGDPQGAWSQAFTFDGFGNLTQKAGSNAPTNAFLATNPATNRFTSNGAQYDNNGNLTAYGTGSFAVMYAYDIENRMSIAARAGTVETLFGYDRKNQRIYQGTYDTSAGVYSDEQIYFYGADGKKLGCWSLTNSGGTYTLTATATNVWFAGRLLNSEDRLQSLGKYFPFGEDRTNPNPANPANDQEKFATYTRDAATGLDYAYQRYYNSQLGRFHTPDPYRASAQGTKPQSWNRYAYSDSDPVNGNDPSGLFASGAGGIGGGYSPEDPFDCDSLSMFFDDQDSYLMMPMSSICNAGLTIALAYYGGGGGGGGGTSQAAINSVKNGLQLLSKRESFSKNCLQGLYAILTGNSAKPMVSPSTLADAADTVTVVNATSDSSTIATASSSPLSAAYQASFNKTYSSYLSSTHTANLTVAGLFTASSGLVAWTPYAGGAIFLDGSRLTNTSGSYDEALAMHELIHEVYGVDDSTIQQDLHIGVNANDTSNITDWLLTNCVSGSGNN